MKYLIIVLFVFAFNCSFAQCMSIDDNTLCNTGNGYELIIKTTQTSGINLLLAKIPARQNSVLTVGEIDTAIKYEAKQYTCNGNTFARKSDLIKYLKAVIKF